MIRLMIDSFGGGQMDLLLKIDTLPPHLVTADSYYLFDFLEIGTDDLKRINLQGSELLKYGAIELLKYWKERIKTIERGQKKFIPFDLSDQYIRGLMLEKTKRGFKTRIVWTGKIQGMSVSKTSLDQEISDSNVEFNDDEKAEWEISDEGIWNGLDWSISELKK